MAARFVTVDRDTAMLLPPDLRDWVAPDSAAKLVVDLVESLDSSSAAVNHRGTGSRQFPPPMMLALLLYSYSRGVFSSREIERATHEDIGVRYICGNTHPDHDTICRFRRTNRDYIAAAFTGSLGLAREAGLIAMGNIDLSADGTKIAGVASPGSNRSVEKIAAELAGLQAEQAQLEGVVEGLLAEAERADREGGEKAAGLPEGLRDPAGRAGALEVARAQLRKKERRRARLEAAREALAGNKGRRAEEREGMREEIRQCDFGTVPKALDACVRPGDIVNTSDPDTQKLKAGNGAGYVQGYNAQAGVDTGGIGLMTSAHVTDHCSDRQQLGANAAEAAANLGAGSIAAMVTDAGYDNTYQVEKVEREHGFEAICIQQRSSNGKEATEATGEARGRVRATREKREAHRERLCKPENRTRRKRRRETIEPAFGVIKEQMGFRRFSLRGLEKADLEWRLVVFAANVRKLSRNDSWKDYLKRASA